MHTATPAPTQTPDLLYRLVAAGVMVAFPLGLALIIKHAMTTPSLF